MATLTQKVSDTDHPFCSRFFKTREEDTELVNRLKSHPEIYRVCKLIEAPDTYGLYHSLPRKKVLGQLEQCLEDKTLPYQFDSFLVRYDEDGILEKAWGLLSENRAWPDSIGFEII